MINLTCQIIMTPASACAYERLAGAWLHAHVRVTTIIALTTTCTCTYACTHVQSLAWTS